MKLRNSRATRIASILAVLLLVVSNGVLYADDGPRLSRYRVTIENLSTGQPLSPPVAATHRGGIRMFRVGHLASPELEAIAEDGNEMPMFNLFNGSDKVTQAVDIARPLTPSGKVVGDFTDSVTFDIQARLGDRLSLATMLICTNDGFTGLDRVMLPHSGSVVYYASGYDAGTEDNTELSADIVDPCSGLGPAPLAGDPNGNEDAAVDTDPHQPIQHHPNIAGVGDLSVADHGWRDPAVKVTITRLERYEVTITNLTDGQPLTPPVLATHNRRTDVFTVGEAASVGVQQIAENGNPAPLLNAFANDPLVFDVVSGAAPLVPEDDPGNTGLAHSATFTIEAARGFRGLSFVSMLICTNDGFTGLDSVRLPGRVGESVVFHAAGYDAGTEISTEDFADMVSPCQSLIGVSSGESGTGVSNPALAEGGVIHHHAGIQGGGDLLPDVHGWSDPVVEIVITRID